MSVNSKIRFFFIPLALSVFLSSCNKKNDVIPDVYVRFTISLSDPEFFNLTTFSGSVLVDSHTNNFGYSAAGYDGNGIIICSGFDEYYAYDRTCPYDYVTNGTGIKVNIDPSNTGIAVCPKCGTKYGLTVGGTPLSGGIGRYPLKNYRTSFDGNNVTVWN